MSTPPPNKDDQSSSCFWYQPSADPSRSPSVPPAMSAPSLVLWSRKLALQSEGLAALIQSSSTKLHSHQEQLQELLKSCRVDLADAKKEIEVTAKQRDNEIDSHLIIIRRLSQTISDVINALDAKLSVLDTLHTLHKKLQAHDLLFRELTAGQEHLLDTQEKLSTAHDKMAAKQESQMRDILRVLDRIEKGQGRIPQTQGLAYGHNVVAAPPVAGEEITVKDSQPQLVPSKSKRQRRLLSDEEMLEEFSPISGHRQLSVELLPFENVKRTKEATAVERNERGVADTGAGSMGSERPPKRKLLNTMDLAQFNADDF